LDSITNLRTLVVKIDIMVIYFLIILSVIDSILVYLANKLSPFKSKLTCGKWHKDYWINLHLRFGVTLTNISKIIISVVILYIYLNISEHLSAFYLSRMIRGVVSIYFFHVVFFIYYLVKLKEEKKEQEDSGDALN